MRLGRNILSRVGSLDLIVPGLIIASALTTILFMLSILAQMVADDYAYFQNIRTSVSPIQYVVEHYTTHNGRLSQASLVTASYVAFGETSVKIMPFLFFTGIALAFAWLIRLTIPLKGNKALTSLLLGTLLSSVAILSTPSLHDSYIWFTSSSVYLGSMIGILITSCLAITLRKMKTIKLRILLPSLLFMALSQSFSEPTSALALSLGGLWILLELIQKNWKHLKTAILVFASLLVGFLVLFLSPGTAARRGDMNSSIDLQWMFVGSLGHYQELLLYLSPWIIGLVVFVGLVAAINTRQTVAQKRFLAYSTIIAVTIFIMSTYITFVVNNFAGTAYAYRNFTLPIFGLVTSLALISFVLFRLIMLKYGSIRPYLILASITIAPLLLMGTVMQSTSEIKALAARESLIIERESDLSRQLGTEHGNITVQAAPVLTISDAVDVENPDEEQTDWLIQSVRGWYGIPRHVTIDIEETDESYCLSPSLKTKEDFACAP